MSTLHTFKSVRRRKLALTALALLASAPVVQAQSSGSYPNRPIRLVVGYPPGGSSDATTRPSRPTTRKSAGCENTRTMLFAAVITALGFPMPPAAGVAESVARLSSARIPAVVWSGIVGMSLMALIQAMMFSFMERLGASRGFSIEQVQAVLIAVSFINLLPALIATWLQDRVPAHRVLLAGPVLQGILALIITQATDYAPFAAASSVCVFVMNFTHIFAFGMFAAQDPSGRAVAATPAMTMTGSAIGPILGGVLVQNLGYEWLGYVIALLAVAANLAFG